MSCNYVTSVTGIKRLQKVQICFTLDAISTRLDWNHQTADRVIEFDSFGKNNKAVSFFQLKLLIKTCIQLIGVKFQGYIFWPVGLDIQWVGSKERYL